MLTILFLIFLFGIFGKLFFFGIRAAGGFKIYFNVSIFPSYLNWNVSYWTRETCFPLLIIFGVVAMFGMDSLKSK